LKRKTGARLATFGAEIGHSRTILAGKFTYFSGKMSKIHRASIIDTERRGGPGEVIRADGAGFWVATASGVLSLEEVQQENKKRLPGVEFIKGARIKPGGRLE
jgi:methionyl-tRNA formyltransferase